MLWSITFFWGIFHVHGNLLLTPTAHRERREVQNSESNETLQVHANNLTCNSTDCLEENWNITQCLSFENEGKYKDNTDDNEEFAYDNEEITDDNEEITDDIEEIPDGSEDITDGNEEEIPDCPIQYYDIGAYKILRNCSALVNGTLIDQDMYKVLQNETLIFCDFDDIEHPTNCNDTHCSEEPSEKKLAENVSILVVQIGSGLSIIALIVHLFTFFILPALRNISDYNLASLSIAFLLGYSFTLIGQIPEVLGLFCILCAVLQQYFLLVAFFCMNVLAFDVWRTLKLATEKLVLLSKGTRRRQFLRYSLYAWGCPVIIIVFSVAADNSSIFPDSIKPHYGLHDFCWMSNATAKAVFFSAPAFTLFVVNGIFFVRSSWIISSNTMECSKDDSKNAVKLNYILYVRLGFMMGLAWLIGIIAIACNNDVLWIIFDLVNSLQGLFLFLLFTCTKKVLKHLQIRASFTSSKTKQTSSASNSSNLTKSSSIKESEEETNV